MKINDNLKKLLILLLSLLASMSILYLTDSSHMVSALALIITPCLYFFINRFFKRNESSPILLIFSAIVSCSLFAGKYVTDLRDYGAAKFPIHAFIYLIALIPVIYTLGIAVTEKLEKTTLSERKTKYEKFIFPISAAVNIICWIPYFLAQYPCAMTYDSIRQVQMAKGIIPITNHHPVLHTLLIKFSLWIGKGSPAAYSIIQIVFLSLIFAFCVFYIYKKTENIPVCTGVLAWFALNPLHAVYSVNMHKDIIFSGLMLLLTIAVTELALTNGKAIRSKKWVILLIMSSLGVCFMRNNGPIVVFAALAVILIIYKKYYKRLIPVICIVLFSFMIIKTALFSAMNVQSTHFVESVGIPLQQIARTVVDCDISDEQAQKISQYLPIEEIKAKYDPYCVDPLKSEVYGTYFNHEALENDKLGFAGLWLELLFRHPATYVKAYIDETYGYWYPLTSSYVTHWAFITENDMGISAQPVSQKLSDILGKLVSLCFNMKIPLVNILFSAAGMVYFCFFFAAPARKKHGKTGLLPYLPLLLLWLTMLIAAPIATSLRYLYSAFTCVPLLVVIPLIGKENKS